MSLSPEMLIRHQLSSASKGQARPGLPGTCCGQSNLLTTSGRAPGWGAEFLT